MNNNNGQDVNKSDISKYNFLPQINSSNGSLDNKYDPNKTPIKK